jgi:hypothetical protein
MYSHSFSLASPVCLLSKLDDDAWKWHARFGHLNFRSLRDLGRKEMVSGLPIVERVEQVCDGCVIGKQQRVPFQVSVSIVLRKDLNYSILIGVVRSIHQLLVANHIFYW